MHQRTYRIELTARFGRDDTALLNVMDLLSYASITSRKASQPVVGFREYVE
jgi:hypothetical protein